MTIDDSLSHGLDLIRRDEYFAAHEVLEDAWRAAAPSEKAFFQGLVHVAVAWYQAGRGNRTGCTRQLEKAARRLGPFAPEYRGVDVEAALASLAKAREVVERDSLELPEPDVRRVCGSEPQARLEPPVVDEGA
ncbi:MAG: DUF309 domain-containing protein [Actinobacteria bacterium]|nr:DUF309 domain-containing protein [Actinomycetota bacterium]